MYEGVAVSRVINQFFEKKKMERFVESTYLNTSSRIEVFPYMKRRVSRASNCSENNKYQNLVC